MIVLVQADSITLKSILETLLLGAGLGTALFGIARIIKTNYIKELLKNEIDQKRAIGKVIANQISSLYGDLYKEEALNPPSLWKLVKNSKELYEVSHGAITEISNITTILQYVLFNLSKQKLKGIIWQSHVTSFYLDMLSTLQRISSESSSFPSWIEIFSLRRKRYFISSRHRKLYSGYKYNTLSMYSIGPRVDPTRAEISIIVERMNNLQFTQMLQILNDYIEVYPPLMRSLYANSCYIPPLINTSYHTSPFADDYKLKLIAYQFMTSYPGEIKKIKAWYSAASNWVVIRNIDEEKIDWSADIYLNTKHLLKCNKFEKIDDVTFSMEYLRENCEGSFKRHYRRIKQRFKKEIRKKN